MCCLFGFLDYKGRLSLRQKTQLVTELAVSAEDRGTDATGIAYVSGGRLRVYKRPLPAHQMRFLLPGDVQAVMGHTRMTTQGSARRNRNNHPFEAAAGDRRFALAHNGMIFNDRDLRRSHGLPATKIETDSYICVQLIRAAGELSTRSLGRMAEELMGSFTVTVLGEDGSLYFIRGDNPMELVHYPDLGLYVYASTKQILVRALSRIGFLQGSPVEVPLRSGDILRLDPDGAPAWSRFDDSAVSYDLFSPYRCHRSLRAEAEYIDQLKAVAGAYGYSPERIDRLLREGFTPEEIEEYFYEFAYGM